MNNELHKDFFHLSDFLNHFNRRETDKNDDQIYSEIVNVFSYDKLKEINDNKPFYIYIFYQNSLLSDTKLFKIKVPCTAEEDFISVNQDRTVKEILELLENNPKKQGSLNDYWDNDSLRNLYFDMFGDDYLEFENIFFYFNTVANEFIKLSVIIFSCNDDVIAEILEIPFQSKFETYYPQLENFFDFYFFPNFMKMFLEAEFLKKIMDIENQILDKEIYRYSSKTFPEDLDLVKELFKDKLNGSSVVVVKQDELFKIVFYWFWLKKDFKKIYELVNEEIFTEEHVFENIPKDIDEEDNDNLANFLDLVLDERSYNNNKLILGSTNKEFKEVYNLVAKTNGERNKKINEISKAFIQSLIKNKTKELIIIVEDDYKIIYGLMDTISDFINNDQLISFLIRKKRDAIPIVFNDFFSNISEEDMNAAKMEIGLDKVSIDNYELLDITESFLKNYIINSKIKSILEESKESNTILNSFYNSGLLLIDYLICLEKMLKKYIRQIYPHGNADFKPMGVLFNLIIYKFYKPEIENADHNQAIHLDILLDSNYEEELKKLNIKIIRKEILSYLKEVNIIYAEIKHDIQQYESEKIRNTEEKIVKIFCSLIRLF